MKEKQPESILRTALYKNLFTKHPVKNAVVENPDLIRTISQEKLLDIYHKFYVPERLIVVVVGKLNANSIMRKIDKHLGNLQQGIAVPLGNPKEPRLKRAKKVEIGLQSYDHCSWMLGFKAPHYNHKDYYAARLVSAFLGDSINSTLFREIREKKGLTYNIRSNCGPPDTPWGSRIKDDCSSWHGVFRIYSQFLCKDLEFIQDITQRELEKLATIEIKEAELRRKQSMLVGQRMLTIEGTLCHMWLLFIAEVNNNLSDFNEFENKVFAVTPEDIQKVAKQYFNLNQSVQVVLKQ